MKRTLTFAQVFILAGFSLGSMVANADSGIKVTPIDKENLAALADELPVAEHGMLLKIMERANAVVPGVVAYLVQSDLSTEKFDTADALTPLDKSFSTTLLLASAFKTGEEIRHELEEQFRKKDLFKGNPSAAPAASSMVMIGLGFFAHLYTDPKINTFLDMVTNMLLASAANEGSISLNSYFLETKNASDIHSAWKTDFETLTYGVVPGVVGYILTTKYAPEMKGKAFFDRLAISVAISGVYQFRAMMANLFNTFELTAGGTKAEFCTALVDGTLSMMLFKLALAQTMFGGIIAGSLAETAGVSLGFGASSAMGKFYQELVDRYAAPQVLVPAAEFGTFYFATKLIQGLLTATRAVKHVLDRDIGRSRSRRIYQAGHADFYRDAFSALAAFAFQKTISTLWQSAVSNS